MKIELCSFYKDGFQFLPSMNLWWDSYCSDYKCMFFIGWMLWGIRFKFGKGENFEIYRK